MTNKNIFRLGVVTLLLSFCLILFGQRAASIVFLIFAAIDFTIVFWTQEDGKYYYGKYARGHRWVDTICVWFGTIFIAITDNWSGLVLFIIPAWSLSSSLKANAKEAS